MESIMQKHKRMPKTPNGCGQTNTANDIGVPKRNRKSSKVEGGKLPSPDIPYHETSHRSRCTFVYGNGRQCKYVRQPNSHFCSKHDPRGDTTTLIHSMSQQLMEQPPAMTHEAFLPSNPTNPLGDEYLIKYNYSPEMAEWIKIQLRRLPAEQMDMAEELNQLKYFTQIFLDQIADLLPQSGGEDDEKRLDRAFRRYYKHVETIGILTNTMSQIASRYERDKIPVVQVVSVVNAVMDASANYVPDDRKYEYIDVLTKLKNSIGVQDSDGQELLTNDELLDMASSVPTTIDI